MKVLVVGATGGTGRAAVDALVAGGHEVTAFARRAGAVLGGRPACGRSTATRRSPATSRPPSGGRTPSW